MKFEIKKRFSGAVQFTAEIDERKGVRTSTQVGLAVEWAIKNKADLRGANLSGADLSGANLSYSNLSGADLSGANLSYSNLSGADLSGADLDGANLDGAYLGGANLDGANLGGAYLGGAYLGGANLGGANLDGAYLGGANLDGANLDGANLSGAYLGGANLDGAGKLIGDRPIIQISPIGSRGDFLTAYLTDNGIFLKTGCFFGTVEKFKSAIKETHGENKHAEEYLAAIALIETHARIYTPKAD